MIQPIRRRKKCFELRISWYAEEKISVDREECYMFMKPCFQFIIRFCTVKLAKLKKSESERELKQSVEMWNAWMKNSWTETVEASERRKRILANLFRVPRFLRMSLIIRWAVQESAFPKNVGVRSFKARQTHVFILFDEHPKKTVVRLLLVDNKMRIRAAPAADAKVVASNIDGGERVEW